MNKIQAIVNFWSGFSIKAYEETSVPDNAELPYLTYELSVGEMNDDISQTANLYYKSTSWSDISLKAEEIYNFIGKSGILVKYDDGAFWIKRTNYSRMDDADDTIKRILINYTVEFIN